MSYQSLIRQQPNEMYSRLPLSFT